MDTELIQCIYCSAATRPMDDDELVGLIERARQNNARLGVTGMLLYADSSFFQVLEGPADVVDPLFRDIALDPRHERVIKVIREAISHRHFSDWSMGLSVLSRAELAELEGSNDFFQAGHCFDAVDVGRAKKLLAAFRQGRWRTTLDGAVSTRGARRARA